MTVERVVIEESDVSKSGRHAAKRRGGLCKPNSRVTVDVMFAPHGKGYAMPSDSTGAARIRYCGGYSDC